MSDDRIQRSDLYAIYLITIHGQAGNWKLFEIYKQIKTKISHNFKAFITNNLFLSPSKIGNSVKGNPHIFNFLCRSSIMSSIPQVFLSSHTKYGLYFVNSTIIVLFKINVLTIILRLLPYSVHNSHNKEVLVFYLPLCFFYYFGQIDNIYKVEQDSLYFFLKGDSLGII